MRKNKFITTLKAAFPHTLPVLAGFLVLGIAYGVLMKTKGYNVIWAVLMSAIAFCGSMQFVAITLLTTIFSPAQAFILSLMVNARHLFYGVSLLDKYRGLGKVRPFLIYTMCDETFSIVSSVEVPEGIDRKYFYFIISALDYFYWVFGSFLGGVAGEFVKFNTKGMDFVLTALFVVLFLEQMKKHENWKLGIIGILSTMFGLLLFKRDNFVIPSMVIILVVLLAIRPKSEQGGAP
ncbi:MAG: branched-chain amino acid transporter AzlC [Clostridia bacterium]|nr:branched-chain amino acid transporter AzlC [Clostridia bacterium]